jgi:hypothetical protein
MQNLRSEILTLLSYRGIVSRQKAFWLMYQHRWTKRKIVEVLAHSLAYRYKGSPFNEGSPCKRGKATIKKITILALSKRKMRPRYLFGDLMIASNINKKRAKNALLLRNEDDFMYFISDLIENNNLFNQL